MKPQLSYFCIND